MSMPPTQRITRSEPNEWNRRHLTCKVKCQNIKEKNTELNQPVSCTVNTPVHFSQQPLSMRCVAFPTRGPDAWRPHISYSFTNCRRQPLNLHQRFFSFQTYLQKSLSLDLYIRILNLEDLILKLRDHIDPCNSCICILYYKTLLKFLNKRGSIEV